jgi:hypothetical protein
VTEYKDISSTVQWEYQEVGSTLRQNIKCDRNESVSQMSSACDAVGIWNVMNVGLLVFA